MSAQLQHYHELPPFGHRLGETASPADLINPMLDLWEAQTQVLIDHGAEFQLRTRIERLLPREEPEADLFVPPPPPLRVASDGAPVSADTELELVALISDCARMEKFKMGALAHAAVARIKGRAQSQLDASRAQRAPAKETVQNATS